jgi:hypothetical protein
MAKQRVPAQEYAEIARSRHHWELHAAAFRFSAEKLYEHMPFDEYSASEDVRTHCVLMYQFLIGLSLEDLLKGLIISAQPDLVIDKLSKPESDSLHTYTLDARLQTHDLSALVGMILRSKRYNLAFSREERELLRRLSSVIKWHGRYPVALTSEKQSSLYFRPVGDKVTFEALWRRVSAALEDVTGKRT